MLVGKDIAKMTAAQFQKLMNSVLADETRVTTMEKTRGDGYSSHPKKSTPGAIKRAIKKQKPASEHLSKEMKKGGMDTLYGGTYDKRVNPYLKGT